MKNIMLILFQWLIATILSTQARAQADSSNIRFPEANAYSNVKLTYKIIDVPATPSVTMCTPIAGY
jgi:hypothetical protein